VVLDFDMGTLWIVWGDIIIYYVSWYWFQVELIIGNNRLRDVGIGSGLLLAECYRDVGCIIWRVVIG
jgi:hypothetical protein